MSSASPTESQKQACYVSNSIPLPSTYISRTESEAQLALDVAAAERSDERMFHRLINGIHDRHRQMRKNSGLPITTSKLSTVTPITARAPPYEFDNNVGNNIADRNGCCVVDPVTSIAKIVNTHHSKIYGSNDCLLKTRRSCQDRSDDERSPSRYPQLPLQRDTAKNHLSHSIVSDNDWSISGYEFCIPDDVSLKFPADPNGCDQDGETDDGIFVLDL